MLKVSIIVPVYNTQKYLKKCLDSIINQTYKNIEVIIVNDGSKDNSEAIIDEYKKRYPNIIKSFKKKNGGLSDARNYGVKKATGDYLSFVDSDDYIDESLFEKLSYYMEKSIDLVKFKTIRISEKGEELERIKGPVFERITGQEAFNKLFATDVYLEPAWLYLYKSDFFNKNKFEFAKGLYHEDFGLTPIILAKAKSVVSLEYYAYYYVQANNSITRNNDYEKKCKMAFDLFKHYDNMLNQIKNAKLSKETIENLKQYYTNAILKRINGLNKDDIKLYKEEIKKRNLIKNIKIRNIRSLLKKIKYTLL